MRPPMRRPACQSEHDGYERLGVDDECRASAIALGPAAQTLEQELEELLAEADADHPIASEVRRRRLADAVKVP